MSKEAKFTPGPWHVDEYCTQVHIVGSDNNATCKVMSLHQKAKANAHLMAAAPDGYSLGEMVMDICGNPKGVSESDQDRLYEAALSFIKRCRGES